MQVSDTATGARKHFVLSPKQEIAKIIRRTETTNAHSVFIPLMYVLYISHRYIPRRGNIVSSLFIWSGRLAMPLFCGRKATSLTSFLFLYPLLIATVWRLAVAEKNLVIMEENYNNIDEGKNIFYEYFSRLEKADVDFETSYKELLRLHKNTTEIFHTILNCIDDYFTDKENLIEKATIKNITRHIPFLYELIDEQKLFQEFIVCFANELNFYIKFFNHYNLIPRSSVYILQKGFILIEQDLRSTSLFNSFGLLFEGINVVDLLFCIFPLITNISKNIIYTKGCIILNISVPKYFSTIANCTSIIYKKLKHRSYNINDDIATIAKAFNFKTSSFSNTYINKNDRNLIIGINEYLPISEYAYKDTSVSLYNYTPKTNIPFLDIDNKGHFQIGKLYACLLQSRNNAIIIGFCGTVINFSSKCLNTFWSDISQIHDISSTYIYAAGVVAHIKELYANNKIVLCGHSLGGGLSQFAAAPHKAEIEAYCFNSAGLIGSYKYIEKFKPFLNIHHYRLENDLISCFGELIGNVNNIRHPKSCCESHSIEAIKDAIKNP